MRFAFPIKRLRMAFNQEETAWIVEKMSEKGVGKGQPGQRPSGRVHRRAESTGKKDSSLQGHFHTQ